ncbi:MAG: DNA methyltransferase [Clostridia bacterium]
MPKFNDIDLVDWKDSDIETGSLWIFNNRDNNGKHDGFFHGNFVPQVPRQLIKRYTKKGDIVFDPFVGSGTTVYEAQALERNFIGIDIQQNLIEYIKEKLSTHKDNLLFGDSTDKQTFEHVKKMLKLNGKERAQFAILHPPYHNIIKFSESVRDLSNSTSLNEFREKFKEVLSNTINILENNRYLAIVIGDLYQNAEWIPLGFYLLEDAKSLGLTLKSIVVKNMCGNRAKKDKEQIWRYRALTSDYYIFKHEYILIFKKNEKK